MSKPTTNRIRLWLRGERAMGLPAVPAPRKLKVSAKGKPAASTQPHATGMRSSVKPSPQSASKPVPQPKVAEPATAFTAAILSTTEKQRQLALMDENEVRSCTKCGLCEHRTHTVFGEGDVDARLVFIGEGPGENEDETGRPFVGRAGKMLDKMIAGMGLQREQVYIANIVKCRPPGNRAPMPNETEACAPYLVRQLEIIRPAVIVTLGLSAAKYMLGDPKITMGRVRGRWHTWRGIKLMPTYHPSYVLRLYTPETRAAVWGDLQQVMSELNLEPPNRPAP